MKLKYSNDEHIFNIHTDGIPYLSFEMFDRLGVPNLFSTRYISYDEAAGTGVKGLRCAVMKTESVEEAAPVCRANRDILAHQLGSSLEMELVTDQKHTNYVHVATCEEDLGVATVGSFSLHRQFVDGIVTDIPDAILTVFGGDCPPVYLMDPVRRVAGLVHAGWKGTLGKIPQVAIAQMTVKFGWGREDADMLLHRYPAKDAGGNVIPGGKYHLDLRKANLMTLLRAGVPADHIAVSNVCTMCNKDTFYSYRGKALENEQVAMMVNRFE